MAHSTIADLHTHSHYSDGSLSPADVRALAGERHVDLLAVTDHDTLAAYRDAAFVDGLGPHIIVGLELSARWRRANIHVVGLDVDPSAVALCAGIKAQATARDDRAQRIAHRLAKRGIVDALSGAQRIAGDAVLGRPHFASYLVAIGAVETQAEAFNRYLGTGKPGDVSTAWPQMSTVVQWIRDAGGVAVLAHPAKYKMTRTRLGELVKEFKAAGGEALEVISGLQQHAQTHSLAKLCEEAGLLGSTGSDFHHPQQRWAELGRGLRLPSNVTPVWSRWQ